MAGPGKPFAHEFTATKSPEASIGDIVLRTEELGRNGYRVESHTGTSAVLVRRFTPELAYDVPLGIAVVAFLIAVFSHSASTRSAAGTITGISVLAAAVLFLTVRSTEHLTFSASGEGAGSKVLVSGSATPTMRIFLERWTIELTKPRAEAPQPDP